MLSLLCNMNLDLSGSTNQKHVKRHRVQVSFKPPPIYLANMLVQTAIVLLGAFVNAQCSNPYTRPSWKATSEPQKQAFLAAVKALKARPEHPSANLALWNYDQFVDAHFKAKSVAHGVPSFLPWHRAFINSYEQALRTIDPSVVLPFWDWSIDSQNPGASDVFSPAYFGTDGQGPDHCILDGVANGWSSKYPTSRQGAACIRRCFAFTALNNPTTISATLSGSVTYDSLRVAIEGVLHPGVHVQTGGSCGDMAEMYSPNDPIFFMHHAFVDRMWWRWQTSCPQFATAFGGRGSTKNDTMEAFGITVDSALSTSGNTFCYSYGSSAGDIPLKPKCPNLNDGNSTNPDASSNSTLTTGGIDWYQVAIKQLLPTASNTTSASIASASTRPVASATHSAAPGVASAAPIAESASLFKVAAPGTNGNSGKIAKRNLPEQTIQLPDCVSESYTGSGNNTLKYPMLVPEKWINMGKFDRFEIRRYECITRKLIDEFNADPTTTDPSISN